MNPSRELRIEVTRREPDAIEAAFHGPVDAHSFKQFEQAMDDLVAARPRRLVLDLSGLDFLSSAGVMGLITTVRLVAQNGGATILLPPPPPIREVFELLGLTDHFSFAPDLKQAWASLHARP